MDQEPSQPVKVALSKRLTLAPPLFVLDLVKATRPAIRDNLAETEAEQFSMKVSAMHPMTEALFPSQSMKGIE